MNCIFCHKNIWKTGNIGHYNIYYNCNYCNVYYSYSNQYETIIAIEFTLPNLDAIYILPSDKTIQIDTEFFSFTMFMPLSWVFPSNILDYLKRIFNLRAFL